MSLLEVSGLTVEFGQRGGSRFRAVDNLSFTLRAGQALALVGESGSGKSTVVRALAQLQKRAAGDIRLDGRPAARRGRALRAYRHEVAADLPGPVRLAQPHAHRPASPGPATAAAPGSSPG